MENEITYFKLEDATNIILVNKDNELLEDNPFSISHNCLYDIHKNLRDDILGKFVRGQVKIKNKGNKNIKNGDKYFFLNEKGEIKSKFNKEQEIDLFHILIGNCFSNKSSLNKIEIERILSIFEFIKENNSSLFPYKIINKIELFNSILELSELEKDCKNFLDKTNKKEESYQGFLKKTFEQEV